MPRKTRRPRLDTHVWTTPGALVLWLASAACAHRPTPPPVDALPVTIDFAPPAAGALLEIIEQERESSVRFPGQPSQTLTDKVQTVRREIWTPLSGGGWRVTSTLLDELAERNGQPVSSVVPLSGVPFAHTVDADGRFVAVDELAESIRSLEERLPSQELRQLLEPLLTPELLSGRMEQAWRQRTEGLCRTTLRPGHSVFGIDVQELPAGGPALTLVQGRVGAVREDPELGPLLEIVLEFGGRTGRLAEEAGARDLLARLPKEAVLADEAHGGGNRLVSVRSCRVVSEEARFEGLLKVKVALDQKVDPSALPEQISFRVHRSARRPDGPEAARVNVPVVTPISAE